MTDKRTKEEVKKLIETLPSLNSFLPAFTSLTGLSFDDVFEATESEEGQMKAIVKMNTHLENERRENENRFSFPGRGI